MEIKKGIYQHYKGNLYEVYMSARHSETQEWLVIYKALYGEEGMWVRPYAMFMEKIMLNGKEVERFRYMG